MYDLFVESRLKQNRGNSTYVEPVKKHLYETVFNTEFNLGFHIPKKDRCDTCEAFYHATSPSQKAVDEQQVHIAAKERTKGERDADRKLTDNSHAVLCFELQNVIGLPRANVSSFFYRRKLNVYNLTAHCAVGDTKKGLCALWHEGMSGRSGNDIASSVVKILEETVKLYPSVSNVTMWSDSCIPQNKNSVMTCALISFLLRNSNIQSLTQKFGEPGHSAIQEVDSVHSQIEKN